MVVGRNFPEQPTVDVDLSEEENCTKISRRHIKISLKSDCEFYIKNVGKRPVYVNGKPLDTNESVRLPHTSLLEVFFSLPLLNLGGQLPLYFSNQPHSAVRTASKGPQRLILYIVA
jgi:hypothetical protein